MIRDVQLKGFEVKEWINLSETDQNARNWIWNQLMGETEKGDSLEFARISRGNELLYAGLLRDCQGMVKGIVPAMYERSADGILKSVDYKGSIHLLELETFDPNERVEQTDHAIDDCAMRFLTSAVLK